MAETIITRAEWWTTGPVECGHERIIVISFHSLCSYAPGLNVLQILESLHCKLRSFLKRNNNMKKSLGYLLDDPCPTCFRKLMEKKYRHYVCRRDTACNKTKRQMTSTERMWTVLQRLTVIPNADLGRNKRFVLSNLKKHERASTKAVCLYKLLF